MHISSFYFSLQLLVLGTVYAYLAGAISPSHAKPAANSTLHFPIPTADSPPSSFAASLTSIDDAIADPEISYLTCHTDLPMANLAGSELVVEACSLLGKKITMLATDLNGQIELLQHIDPTILQQFLTLDLFAYELEKEHGCRTSNQDKTHCIWLSRLRDELSQLRTKIRGPDDTGYDGIDLETLDWRLEQILHEMDQINTELSACLSLDSSHCISVLISRFRELLKRVTGLEKEARCPEHAALIICNGFRELKKMAELTLRKFPGEVNMDA